MASEDTHNTVESLFNSLIEPEACRSALCIWNQARTDFCTELMKTRRTDMRVTRAAVKDMLLWSQGYKDEYERFQRVRATLARAKKYLEDANATRGNTFPTSDLNTMNERLRQGFDYVLTIYNNVNSVYSHWLDGTLGIFKKIGESFRDTLDDPDLDADSQQDELEGLETDRFQLLNLAKAHSEQLAQVEEDYNTCIDLLVPSDGVTAPCKQNDEADNGKLSEKLLNEVVTAYHDSGGTEEDLNKEGLALVWSDKLEYSEEPGWVISKAGN